MNRFFYIVLTPAPYDTRNCTFCPFIQNSYQATMNDGKNPKIQKSPNPKNFARFRRCEKFGCLDFYRLDFFISDICKVFLLFYMLFACGALLLVHICSS